MKKYLIIVGITTLVLIVITALTFVATATFLVTDETPRVPGILKMLCIIFSFPILLINKNWPWDVNNLAWGLCILAINSLIQAHLIYLTYWLLKKVASKK